MKKQIIFIAIALLFFCATSTAQSKGRSYTTALGVKFLDGGGITLKHFIKKNTALEGIAFFWNRGVRFTGLYELHFDINGAPGLKWYVGPGAHVGFYSNNDYNKKYYYNDGRYNGTFIGIDGVLGLDYKINNTPLNLSLDWQPSFEFGTGRGFTGNWGGFGVRYTF
jgi:hypothetical protein